MKKYLILLFLLVAIFLFTISGLILFSSKPGLLKACHFSRVIYDKQGKVLKLNLSPDDKYRVFIPLNQVPKQLIDTTILQEDQFFYYHWGVNPGALFKAIWNTYVLQVRRFGASTITMQVARLYYKLPTKTWRGKLEQILRALQLEWHFSKNDILEAYLNLAPYGANIEGVAAASLIYFNTHVQRLNLLQNLSLTVIPQNPGKRANLYPVLFEARRRLFLRWIDKHPEDKKNKVLIHLPLKLQPVHNMVNIAPHFLNHLFSQNNLDEIISTLEIEKQKMLEKVCKQYLLSIKPLGVKNLSALIVDSRDMSIKAEMGSADFFNAEIGGQIDGTLIKRSPGSTLKPFIYSLAMDQGIIHPGTVLKDVPRSFRGYNPENFDYQFMGPLNATEALNQSRNIPAIELASLLNKPSLHQLLERIEISGLRPESFYGLSLSLGGIEISMVELVEMYGMIINAGKWQTLKYHVSQETNATQQISPESAFLTWDMLKNAHVPSNFREFQNKVAWKTGTSSGYRDAWTVGFYGPYIIAVWLGNFDNSANPALVGKYTALPLFLRITSALKGSMAENFRPYDPEKLHLKKVEVCKSSGKLPNEFCPDRVETWFIPGKSPIDKDTVYREIAIDSKSGLRTCHYNQSTQFVVAEFWSSDLLSLFKKAGIYRQSPPPFEEGCINAGTIANPPHITSPAQDLNYLIGKQSTQIPFTAVSESGINYIYWFVNQSFVAKTKINETFLWTAKTGTYVVRAVDDRGMSDARKIHVNSV